MTLRRRLATLFSAVFHPLLLPSYLFYVVCYQLPGVVQHPPMPERGRLLSLVVLFTLVLPAVGTALLLWRGLITGSLELRERQQRPLPLLLATLSFGAAAVLMHRTPQLDALLPRMMTGMALAVLLTLLVSLRWKISAHSVGVGGAVGLLALLQLESQGGPGVLWYLVGSGLLAGAVLWARLTLEAHTPAQAWAGLVLGVGLVLGLGVILK